MNGSGLVAYALSDGLLRLAVEDAVATLRRLRVTVTTILLCMLRIGVASEAHRSLTWCYGARRAIVSSPVGRVLLVFLSDEAHICMAGATMVGRASQFWLDTRHHRSGAFSRT